MGSANSRLLSPPSNLHANSFHHHCVPPTQQPPIRTMTEVSWKKSEALDLYTPSLQVRSKLGKSTHDSDKI